MMAGLAAAAVLRTNDTARAEQPLSLHCKPDFLDLKDGQPAVYENLSKRIKRVGALLGATAFHLFSMNNHAEKPEPNTSGAACDDIRDDLIQRLADAGHGGEIEFDHDYGWGRDLGSRLRVVPVPGDHLGILEPPNVTALGLNARQLLGRETAAGDGEQRY